MDVGAANICLRCVFGDDRAAIAPATWEVALFTNFPELGGVELDPVGGYAAASVANTTANWPTPTLGAITSAPISFGTSTGEWSDVATVAVIRAGGFIYYGRPLMADEEIDVTVAGQVVDQVRVIVDWNQVVI
ncbi:MAG TPA: hypothetical protein VJL80_09765 [Aeromicrobium sp.]|nr:hypothetical protein [Aeromicrobium sp.]HKY58312.1 hypothetical protein [Aeromicrobium sp.]